MICTTEEKKICIYTHTVHIVIHFRLIFRYSFVLFVFFLFFIFFIHFHPFSSISKCIDWVHALHLGTSNLHITWKSFMIELTPMHFSFLLLFSSAFFHFRFCFFSLEFLVFMLHCKCNALDLHLSNKTKPLTAWHLYTILVSIL